MKRGMLTVLALALLTSLAACGKEAAPKPVETPAEAQTYTEISADGSDLITISTEGITETARFYNYPSGDVTVQLVALRDAAGEVHIAFNTCQSCSPSPKAYYRQSGDELQCANCGFTFAPEEVGLVQGGCNPWPIDGAEIGPEEIALPAASLKAMTDRFASWGGPTK